LECAGNGRAFYQLHVPGVQWERGAVGNARCTGPRLKDVLSRAGVKNTGKFVAFFGLDEPPAKRLPPRCKKGAAITLPAALTDTFDADDHRLLARAQSSLRLSATTGSSKFGS